MFPIIDAHKKELFNLCEKYKVEKLYAFGSLVNGNFNEKTSDIDFLYLMQEREDPLDMGEAILQLYIDLNNLFDRKVDLTSQKAMRNKYFIEEVNNTKVLIYG